MRARRRLAAVVAGLVAVAVVATGGGAARAESPWALRGRQAVLAWVVPAIGERLGLRLRIGHVTGALPRVLVLEDVALLDETGRPRATVERITVELDVRALARREVRIERAMVMDIRAWGRIDRAGKLDLLRLVQPPPSEKESSGPGATIGVEKLVVSGRAIVDVDARATLARRPLGRGVAASFAGELGIAREGGRLRVDVRRLGVDVARPVPARVEVSGGLDVAGRRVMLRGVQTRVAVEARRVARAVTGAEWASQLRGEWEVRVGGGGPLEALSLALRITAPRGEISGSGRVVGLGARGEEPEWRARIVGRGIDPSAAFVGAPHGTVELSASGAGRGAAGELRLERLSARATGARALATGKAAFGGGATRAEGALSVDVAELAALHVPELHAQTSKLHGSVSARAEGRWDGATLTVAARFEGAKLRSGETRVGGASAHLALDGAGLRAIARAHDVAAGSALRLDDVSVAASGDACTVAATVDVRRRGGIEGALALHGRTLGADDLRADESRGAIPIDVKSKRGAAKGPNLSSRRCVAGGDALALGRLLADPALRPRGVALSIDRLRLAGAGQRWHAPKPGRLRVVAGERGASIDGAIALKSLGGQELAVALTRAPNATLRLDAHARALDVARLAALAIGESRASSLPSTRLSIDARAELDATRLRGVVEVVDRGARVELDVDAPRALVDGLGGKRRTAAPTSPAAAPITARLLADNIVLERFSALLPKSLARLRGTAQARLRLSGRANAPVLDGDLIVAHGSLGPTPQGAPDVELLTRLHAADDTLTLSTEAHYGSAPLVTVEAKLRAPFARLLAGERPRLDAIALTADARVPAFDLSRVGTDLGGKVSAVAQARGTLAALSATVDARGDRLRIGELFLPHVALRASADRTEAHVTLDARSAKASSTGRLQLIARVPLSDATRPLEGTLRATDFAFAFGTTRGENVSRRRREDGGPPARVSGFLDGALTLSGTRDRPLLRGRLSGRDLGLAIATLGRPLTKGRFHLDVNESAIVLSELDFTSGNRGHISGKGRAALDGLRPTQLQATVELKHLPIIQSGIAAELDARLAIRGERSAEGLTGTITVEDGSARLPKLAVGRKLQPTGPLEDVVFVDAEAKRQAARAAGGSRLRASVVARIPGPFRVRAPELNADLEGTIEINTDEKGRLRLGGSVETREGTFELLNRRYAIERARVAFTGADPPNPVVDIRIARQLPATRIIVVVQGTVGHPTLTLTSDPPIYDSSQVLAIVLGGDPDSRTPRDPSRAQDLAVGALSGLIIGKLRDQVLPGLPIDVLKVDTGTEGGFATTRLEVGKWIGDRVYISYVHQFGATTGIRRRNSNEGAIQYQVGRGFSIDTRFGDAAVGAIDFFWTLRF